MRIRYQLYPVPGMEGLFVSKDGIIAKRTQLRIEYIKQYKNTKGYQYVWWNNKRYLSHRIVALTFHPNPEGKPHINHLNGIRDDNRFENLRWCTVSENNLHQYHVLNCESQYPKRQVVVFKNGAQIKIAKSVRRAAHFVNGSSTNVSKCCKGKRKTHNGFTFQYATPHPIG